MSHTFLIPSCVTVAIMSAMAVVTSQSHAAETVIEGISTAGADADRVKIWYRCDGTTCDFEAVVDQQLTDEAIEYQWDFSDGSVITTTDPLATHTWAIYGDKDTKLSIYDQNCDLYFAEAAFTLSTPSLEPDSATALPDSEPSGGDVSEPGSYDVLDLVSPLPTESNALSSTLVQIGQDTRRLVSEPLEGVDVRGDVFIFIETLTNAESVSFELSGMSSDTVIKHTESNAPYDFAGGSALVAKAFDTRSIADGSYWLDIVATYKDGKNENLAVSFKVSNVPEVLDEPSAVDALPEVSEQPLSSVGELVYSSSSRRSNSTSLDGVTLAGNVYMSLAGVEDAQSVQFFIDNENLQGSPYRVEKRAPWDVAGGSVNKARSFDTRRLNNGLHVLSAQVFTNGNSFVTHASFSIAN